MTTLWVRPDVPAIDKLFAYAYDGAEPLPVGTVVRVPLQGRKVRGWVVEPQGPAPGSELRAIVDVVSAGPPPEVVALADWTAWRYAGNPVALLRVASPPNRVRDLHAAPGPQAPAAPPGEPVRRLVAVPPTADRMPLIRAALAEVGSTIVILPPGDRAHRLVDELRASGRPAVAYTGALTAAERTTAWRRARQGGCVVVGGRVAAFAPVPDLSALVVLDENDEALTEERVPTWNARTVAVERARRRGCPLLLVSPAPSLEARELVSAVERPERSSEREGWPLLEVVDRRAEEHRVGILTVAFSAAAHRALDRGHRVVAVVNRKGRVRLYACGSCRELVRCERCQAAMTEANDGLECPKCAATRPRVCAACFGTRLVVVRSGVTRLADDLRALLPRARVVDVDSSVDDVPAADVLIGTEAVLHRVLRDRRTGLVAFLDFDQELLAPRLRAFDQAQWLLVRAARLAGRRDRGGQVLVQTTVPDHPVIVAARTADPLLVADAERPGRMALGFPPFGGLAAVRGDRSALEVLIADAPMSGIEVIGPTAAGDGVSALMRACSSDVLAAFLAVAAPAAREAGRIRVEVDPQRA